MLWAGITTTYSSHSHELVRVSFGHCVARGFTQHNHHLKRHAHKNVFFGVLGIKTTSTFASQKPPTIALKELGDLSFQPEVSEPLRSEKAQTTFSKKFFESFMTTAAAPLTSYWE